MVWGWCATGLNRLLKRGALVAWSGTYTELTVAVAVAVDELVGIGELERAALEFARSAPAELIGVTVTEMADLLIDEVCGPRGVPIPDEEQVVTAFPCPGRGSLRGFRRRGQQVRQRKVKSLVGVAALTSRMVRSDVDLKRSLNHAPDSRTNAS